ncbi:MAG: 23S rRNA (adenine(2503)-C(2))-methyltransferase, partial [Planctomycetes bacterium RBG_16_43_13]
MNTMKEVVTLSEHTKSDNVISVKTPLSDLTLVEFEGIVEKYDSPKFHARQILLWLYRHNVTSFDEMTDVPLELRRKLTSHFNILSTKIRNKHTSADGTDKLVIELADGNFIETVLIREGNRKTVCISTQVGCPIKCVFCASGLNGLKRNLTTAEIVEQVLHIKRYEPQNEETPPQNYNIVVMGIGEPLLNFDNLVKALKIFKASWGMGIGYNRITLSTVGTLLNRLQELVERKVTPNLALSLHAPNDTIRKMLVPTLKVKVAELIKAGIEYKSATGKDVTFEYVLIKGINDSKKHALELGKKLHGKGCKVNVIPYNRVAELPYEEPTADGIDKFVDTLGGCGV